MLSEKELGSYFRALYRCINYVNLEPNITIKEKYEYVFILRASLSSSECAIIYYNGNSHYAKNMKPLIEEYGLLKHLPAEYIKRTPFVAKEYDIKSFGRGTPASKEAALI